MIQIFRATKVLRFETTLEAIEFQREVEHMIMCLGGSTEENRKKYPFVFQTERLLRLDGKK